MTIGQQKHRDTGNRNINRTIHPSYQVYIFYPPQKKKYCRASRGLPSQLAILGSANKEHPDFPSFCKNRDSAVNIQEHVELNSVIFCEHKQSSRPYTLQNHLNNHSTFTSNACHYWAHIYFNVMAEKALAKAISKFRRTTILRCTYKDLQ